MSQIEDKLLWLQQTYNKNPVLFAEHLFNMELSGQQKELLTHVVSPNARVACKSATGTGKTTTAGLAIFHQLLTEPDCKVLAAAPSAGQLERGLRAELSKLHSMLDPVFQPFYGFRQDKIFITGKKDTQFCSLVSTDTDNKESLAGVHARKVLVILDEASAVEQDKYDTLMGNLTTEGSSIAQISNPVRSDGPFRALWSNPDNAKIWKLITLTAFDTHLISKDWIDLMRSQYGEDSDFWRMRVLGEFPRVSEDTFFSADAVEAAAKRSLPLTAYYNYPKVVGADIARFGSDSTVFVLRQGPKILDIQKYKGLDTEEVASELLLYYSMHSPSMVYIDANGLGGGVFDKIKRHIPAIGIETGGRSSEPSIYANLRTQLYGHLKLWLSNDADIPDSNDIVEEFKSMRYAYNIKNQVQLLSKDVLKRKFKVGSPDIIDAASFTFADAVYRKPGIYSQARTIKRSNYNW